MRRSARLLVPVLSLAILTLGGPGTATAADPRAATIPPLRAEGAVRLPNGKVLPLPPAGATGPSEMATAWAEHAHDAISFTPGAVPRALAPSSATLSSAGSGGVSTTTLLALAPSTSADATLASDATLAALPNGLRKQVFGFLPYWMLSATDLQWMRYDAVSTIAYFGVAARSDGTLVTSGSTWSGWNSSAMTDVINKAHARGDRVVLTITMMAWDSTSANAQATLLGSSTYRARLVNNIIAQVKSRNVDGVNLDFEPVATSQRDRYTSFVRQLKAALVAAKVGSYLTVCTTAGAATWSTGYDVAALGASGAADGIFVMGYDYSWSGSGRAGGVAPMSSSYMLDVNESVNDFLSLTSGSKLIWGVPYYGRTWLTTSNTLNSTTVSGASGSSKAYYYTGAKSLAATYGRKWDSVGKVPWFVYRNSSGQWVEGYYDDTTSLGVKYDMINQRGLAGVGIWHLLMDQGVGDLWNLLANKFQADTVPPAGGITVLPPVTSDYSIPVTWRAVDVGSGVAGYTVQVRDRASSTWATWLAGTTATSATYPGVAGHTYEFRMSATDKLGNTQAWTAPMADPGASLAVGGFASNAVDGLNVRSGAGTGFASLAQLTLGERVAILSGPVSSGGYAWYQVQFDFSEWPSADYPRTGWAAAGYGSTAYLVPAVAPTVTALQPGITGYALGARYVSPNGDGRMDSVTASYALDAGGSVRLDVLNAVGSVIDSTALGTQGAGSHTATWDGRTSGGSVAPEGAYVLRITSTDGTGAHVAPATTVSAAVLTTWGVTLDVTAPVATAVSPSCCLNDGSNLVTAGFSEPVTGVNGTSFSITDQTSSTAVAATVSATPDGMAATLDPNARLAAGHTFRAVLTGDIRDRAGNAVAWRAWTFATTPTLYVYSPTKGLLFAAGTTVGYKFDSAGKIIASRSYSLARASGAATDRRSEVIPGHPGGWFRVVNGVWAGYWVPESARVHLPGVATLVVYSPVHQVTFTAGTYTAVLWGSGWTVSRTRSATLARPSGASADRWVVINGRQYVRITNGIWAGWWMPLGGGAVIH